MPAGNGVAEAVAKKASPRRRTQTGQPVAGAAAAPPEGESAGGPAASAPLSAVVTNAVRRWFVDTHKEAIRGDVVRPSLVWFLLLILSLFLFDPELGCVQVSALLIY